MFAIIRTGGKQYSVKAGDVLDVEKLEGETGDKITLSDVLFSGTGKDAKLGGNATVTAEIVKQGHAPTVLIFKKKRRHNYRRKNGHRQKLTTLKVLTIN